MGESNATFPVLRAVVIDTTDARTTAEFYRQLLGFSYRPGHEPPPPGEADPWGQDWLVLVDSAGVQRISFQQIDELPASTWPSNAVPQQLHLDLAVSTAAELRAAYERALALGARLLFDRTDDPDEALYVLADPAGHPFCLLVG